MNKTSELREAFPMLCLIAAMTALGTCLTIDGYPGWTWATVFIPIDVSVGIVALFGIMTFLTRARR